MPIYTIYCNYKSDNNNYPSKHKSVAMTLSQSRVVFCLDVVSFFIDASWQYCDNGIKCL